MTLAKDAFPNGVLPDHIASMTLPQFAAVFNTEPTTEEKFETGRRIKARILDEKRRQFRRKKERFKQCRSDSHLPKG